MIRHTVVCRNVLESRPGREPRTCGGGWWGENLPARCPRCGGQLTELAPTLVIALEPT